MSHLTDQQLAELRALHEKATQKHIQVIWGHSLMAADENNDDFDLTNDDLRLFAATHTALPALLAEIAQGREANLVLSGCAKHGKWSGDKCIGCMEEANARMADALKVAQAGLTRILPEWDEAAWRFAANEHPGRVACEISNGDALAIKSALSTITTALAP